MIWPRAAPSAVRIDISRDRLDARASIRLATLKQAMSSTIVTAPIIVRMISGDVVGDGPVAQRPDPDAAPLVGVGKRGRQVRRRPRPPSCCACSSVTPSRSRANTSRPRAPRFWLIANSESGSQRYWFSGNLNCGGMTPMTVCGREFTWMARPMIVGSRVVAALPEIVGDEHDRLGALRDRLPRVKPRPSAGDLPSSGNSSWLIAPPE